MVRLGHRSDFSPAGSGALYEPQGTQKENSTVGRSRHVAVNGSGRIPRDEITAAAYSIASPVLGSNALREAHALV